MTNNIQNNLSYKDKYLKYSMPRDLSYKDKYLKYKKKYLKLKGGYKTIEDIKKLVEELKKQNIKVVDIETIKENNNIYLKINLGNEKELEENGKLITDKIEAVCKHFGIGYKFTQI
jgi:hypothetical protein